MALITIALSAPESPETQARAWCQRLEAGDILYFPQTPIQLPPRGPVFSARPAADGQHPAQEHRLQAESGQRERPGRRHHRRRGAQAAAGDHAPVLAGRDPLSHPLFVALPGTLAAGLRQLPARRRKRAATCRCAAATTCCTPTLSLRGLRAARASCASLTTFTPRARATGWSATRFPCSRPGMRRNRFRSLRPATPPAARCARWPTPPAWAMRFPA